MPLRQEPRPLELTTVLGDGTVWRSRPLNDDELADVAARRDRVGEIHRVVEKVRRENAALIAELFPPLNRCLTGYDPAHIRDRRGRFDLNAVLCGSEGTLGFIAEAKLAILPIPRASMIVTLRYTSFDAALRDAAFLGAFGAASIETVDSKVLGLARSDIIWPEVSRFLPDEDGSPAFGINLVEFVGESAEAVTARVAIPDAEVRLEGLRQDKFVTLGGGRTDQAGAFDWMLAKRQEGEIKRIVVQKGLDTLVIEPDRGPSEYRNQNWTKPQQPWLAWTVDPAQKRAEEDKILCHVFTERPIYRPEETVQVKGFVRRYLGGALSLPKMGGTLVVTGPDDQSWRYPVARRGYAKSFMMSVLFWLAIDSD